MSTPPEHPHDPSQPYGQQPQYPSGPQGTPPGGPGYQAYGGAGVPPSQPTAGFPQAHPGAGAGFFGALFDFSFREFVTTRIIKVLFVLWLILIGLFTLSGLISSVGMMSLSPVIGILSLFGSLIGGAIAVLLSRVVLELLIVVFRISEDLSVIRRRGGM